MRRKKYIIYMIEDTKTIRFGEENSLRFVKSFLKNYYGVELKRLDKNWYYSVGTKGYNFNVEVIRG